MIEFGSLPPEVNSGRMYTGPGAGPFLAAARSWDGLANELRVVAASYESVLADLSAGWQGASSTAMSASAAPYVAWMNSTAALAEQTAGQAKAAALAYENAYAATVPPPVVAANRSQLLALIATNLLGQNTAAIAATELQYAEMWAQDAAAMYNYAASSVTASSLRPFTPPPQTTSENGPTAQAAAVAHASGSGVGSQAQNMPQLMSGLSQALQTLGTPASTTAAAPTTDSSSTVLQLLSYAVGGFNPVKLYDPFGAYYDEGIQSFLAPFNNYNMQMTYSKALSNAGLTAAVAGPGVPAVSSTTATATAGLGNGGVVGALSVPPGWAGAAPATRPVAFVLPASDLSAVPSALEAGGEGNVFSNMALSGMAGRAVVGTGTAVGPGAGGAANAVPGDAVTATIIVIPED